MVYIKFVTDYILGLGASVMLPIMVILFGLLMKQGFTRSFRSGLIIGIGFVGINLVIGLLFNSLGPATTAFVESTGAKLDVIDVGWPVTAAISWGTPVAAILIPIIFIVNIIMLMLNVTDTMDIDLWNYWHFIFAASVAYYTFNNIFIGIIVGVITAIITFKLADWTYPTVYYFFGLKGVSMPHALTICWAPITYALEKIENKIPGINKIKINEETLSKKLGVFGEPIVLGLVFGIVMGLLARYDVKSTLELGVKMAGVLYILPKMVAILMEGLIPLSEGIRDVIYKRFPNKKVHIGLDSAIVIGHPTNMTVSLIMIPITIVLAIILPFNRVLPFADLAAIPFVIVFAVAASKGNIFRSILNSIVVIIIVLFVATNLAPITTTIGKSVGFDFPADANSISAVTGGSELIPWIMIKLINIKNSPGFILGIILFIIYAALWIWTKNDIKKQYATEIEADKREEEQQLAAKQ